MDLQLLIVLGSGLLLACTVLIPAESEIFRTRHSQHDQPHARRDYMWGLQQLQHLSTAGFLLLFLYLMLNDPTFLDSLLQVLSLK